MPCRVVGYGFTSTLTIYNDMSYSSDLLSGRFLFSFSSRLIAQRLVSSRNFNESVLILLEISDIFLEIQDSISSTSMSILFSDFLLRRKNHNDAVFTFGDISDTFVERHYSMTSMSTSDYIIGYDTLCLIDFVSVFFLIFW